MSRVVCAQKLSEQIGTTEGRLWVAGEEYVGTWRHNGKGKGEETQVTDEYFSSFLYQKVAPQIREFTPKRGRASRPESGLGHPLSRVSKPHGQTQEIPCFFRGDGSFNVQRLVSFIFI